MTVGGVAIAFDSVQNTLSQLVGSCAKCYNYLQLVTITSNIDKIHPTQVRKF